MKKYVLSGIFEYRAVMNNFQRTKCTPQVHAPIFREIEIDEKEDISRQLRVGFIDLEQQFADYWDKTFNSATDNIGKQLYSSVTYKMISHTITKID